MDLVGKIGKILAVGGLLVATSTYVGIMPKDIGFYTNPQYNIPKNKVLDEKDIKKAFYFITGSSIVMITGIGCMIYSKRKK